MKHLKKFEGFDFLTNTPNKAIQWFSEIIKDPKSENLERYKY